MKLKVLWIVGLICMASVGHAEEPGLPVGSIAPDFVESVAGDDEFIFSDLYKENPVVLVFYRGGWCKYCNIQLQEYQQRIEEFEALGVQVIAVSVDTKANVAEYTEEQKLKFRVIGNPAADLLKMYNVMFYVPQELAKKYKEEYNIDLNAASDRRDGLIAVPATYVVNSEGVIVFSSADTDYKVRPKLDDVLDAAKKAKQLDLVM